MKILVLCTFLVALLLIACNDPARPRLPIDVVASPSTQTAGGTITLNSLHFDGVVLQPAGDAPNRWKNLVVTIDNDTLDAWRVGPLDIAFRVPALYTGDYEARVRLQGYQTTPVSFHAVGLAYPPYSIFHAYSDITTGVQMPGRGLLVAEPAQWPGFQPGYLIFDVGTRSRVQLVGLEGTDQRFVKMYSPGPSYRRDHYVIDLSPSGSATAVVWRITPPDAVALNTIPCSRPGGSYTAAEIAAGVCLYVDMAGNVVRNGLDTLVRAHGHMRETDFRMAPGGKWTALRTRPQAAVIDNRPMRWPVFDQSGGIAYTIDTLAHVPGVTFSENGDTLFAAVGLPDATAPNLTTARYAVVALESASGSVIRSFAFPPDRVLQDVLIDPVRPLLYVGGYTDALYDDAVWDFSPDHRQYLTILDRNTFEMIADIPAPKIEYRMTGDATLVLGASEKRIDLLAWCGFDCGALHDYAFDVP